MGNILDNIEAINDNLAQSDALDVIRWAYSIFGDKLSYACSFGAEGMVLIDLISKIRPDARVVFLDTHLHFKETYELIDRVKRKYPFLQIDMIEPELTIEAQAQRYGAELWQKEPDRCCHLRKVEPLARALQHAEAWLSGLRRQQSASRTHTNYVNRDPKFHKIKICPLIHWSWENIWSYIQLHQLPYNALHDRGYPSIGCENCTQPVIGQDDSREGRWTGFNKKECGLHQ